MSVSSYYGNLNIDLLRWVPLDARRVLELGCGEGAFAAAYKERNPHVDYVAVETHAPSAAIARGRVDTLVEADFMNLDPEALARLGRFDAIVLGDVLEHLPDPWRALRTLNGLLADDGRLCLSVPNVSHWTALAHLMTGVWPAEASGLFDRTHLRFFTLKSLQETLAEAGFSLEQAKARKILIDKNAAERWIPLLAAAAEQAGAGKADFINRAQTLQYVTTAYRKRPTPPFKLNLHIIAMAPNFLDVRTRLPAEAMQSEPSLVVSYKEKSAILPSLPAAAPKVAVLQRLIMPEEEDWRAYVDRARSEGWLLVYEIDDDPDLIGSVHPGGTMAAQLRTAINCGCHAVQTSTPVLAEALRALNPEVAVFENAVLDLPPFQARERARRVFYGALNRESFSGRVAAALAPAIDAQPELEFLVVHDRVFFDALPTERKKLLPALSYSDYLAAMASCDIVLSPLEGTPGETYKSDVKFLEAARCGAAMIASPCVYQNTIEVGHNGLIACDLSDWPKYLARLAGDPDRRNAIAEAAWREVRDRRMLAQQIPARRDWYMDLYARRSELDTALTARRHAPAENQAI